MACCVVFIGSNGSKAFGSKALYMTSGDYDPLQADFSWKSLYVGVLLW
jgi:hypothetical protein